MFAATGHSDADQREDTALMTRCVWAQHELICSPQPSRVSARVITATALREKGVSRRPRRSVMATRCSALGRTRGSLGLVSTPSTAPPAPHVKHTQCGVPGGHSVSLGSSWVSSALLNQAERGRQPGADVSATWSTEAAKRVVSTPAGRAFVPPGCPPGPRAGPLRGPLC